MKKWNRVGFLILLFGFLLVSQVFAFQTTPQVATPDTHLVNQLLTETLEDISNGRFVEAKNKIKRAEQLSDSLRFESGKALSIVRLGDVLLNQQKNDSVIAIMKKALRDFPKSIYAVDFYNFMATAFQYKSESDTAIKYYNKSLSLIPNLTTEEHKRKSARIRLNMASSFINMGDKRAAFGSYISAVRFAEMTRDTAFWVTTLNNIGDAYNQVENYDKASFYLEKAKSLAETKNYKTNIYRIYLNLANTRNAQGRFEEAELLYKNALKIVKEIRPDSPPVQILYNLGNLNRRMGNFEAAEKNFRESLTYSANLNILPGLFYNKRGLGELFYDQQLYEESVLYLTEALQVATELQNTPFMQQARELLYKAYDETGQYEHAYQTLHLYKATTDSLFTIEKEQALASLENQLALDRQNEVNKLLQEKQIEQEQKLGIQLFLIIAFIVVIALILVILFLMRKRVKEREEVNIQLKRQKDELEEVNQTKDKLFAIISHDLRSPLSSMQGILYLIKNSVLSKDKLDELIHELQVSIQQNVDTMEDLLAWANKQLSGIKLHFINVNVYNLTTQVLDKQFFMASKKGVELINSVDESCQIKADKNGIELVLRNLVSNAIKFTNNGGSVIIDSKEYDDQIEVSVRDTGIGMTAEVSNRIFDAKIWSREGTDREKGSGFGLSLVKEFIERMNGTIHFESEEKVGSTFYITLPKAPSILTSSMVNEVETL